MKPVNYKPILTVANAKTIKGEPLGYFTGIFYGAPSTESGVINTCPKATAECKSACLYTAGRGAMGKIRRARIAKTLFYYYNEEAFFASLRYDIESLQRKANKLGFKPAVRINGTTDLYKIALKMADEFPNVQFYDYTKLPKPYQRIRPNYDLTFSYSGRNEADCIDALEHNINVAVVFGIKKGSKFPKTWNGYKVISGDNHDLRFLDPKGVVIGLYAKGKARKIASKFVVLPEKTNRYKPQLIQIKAA